MCEFRSFSQRVGSRIRDAHYRTEVEEEIEQHLEMAAMELQSQGMSPEEARAEAIRSFGDPEVVGDLLQRTGRGGGPMREAMRGTFVGAVASATMIVLFFLVVFGVVEPLRGYAIPDWSHGLNAWAYLGLALTGLGAVAGGLAGWLWGCLRSHRVKGT